MEFPKLVSISELGFVLRVDPSIERSAALLLSVITGMGTRVTSQKATPRAHSDFLRLKSAL